MELLILISLDLDLDLDFGLGFFSLFSRSLSNHRRRLCGRGLLAQEIPRQVVLVRQVLAGSCQRLHWIDGQSLLEPGEQVGVLVRVSNRLGRLVLARLLEQLLPLGHDLADPAGQVGARKQRCLRDAVGV
ncbi:hypothetical protein FBU59_004380 [Linderina macrospora]|uniref:Uncharacterized protein n=1 Tax=Linderina macrospora TaxID=4868 RepID=A0ACC1J5K3_9FUNG|nr:hypothetical protein FBU59_004380 [Linderina macrospora]